MKEDRDKEGEYYSEGDRDNKKQKHKKKKQIYPYPFYYTPFLLTYSVFKCKKSGVSFRPFYVYTQAFDTIEMHAPVCRSSPTIFWYHK